MLSTRAVPPTFTYRPNFITAEEEERLLAKVASAPQPKWTTLKNRRLQNWGATPIAAKNNVALPEKLPDWLAPLADRIAAEVDSAFVFDGTKHVPNHCLVNEYHPGQGIMPHLDGPAYRPTVATVSLGEYCILEFYKRRNLDEVMVTGEYDDADSQTIRPTPDFRFLIQPRSLVMLQDEMYEGYLHGIGETWEDVVSSATIDNWTEAGMSVLAESDEPITLKRQNTRVSLTFRVAAKVSKLNLFGKKR
ncbi:hypothetical protein HDU79_007152 [Rhizoclosmatium sp. JEL0117]|nr:hypothetical protein HDU79_007152 [Rhizoclosmatium sp. JEL0117]